MESGAFATLELVVQTFPRNERAAKERAIECAKSWADVQQDIRPYLDACEAAGLPNHYSGQVGDFFFTSLPADLMQQADAKEKIRGWAKPINRLEALAAEFNKGVADDNTGFEIMGRDYCDCIKALYDVLAATRRKRVLPIYSNIVELYQRWAPRVSLAKIDNERAELDIKREKTPIKPHPTPIGVSSDNY